MTDAPTNNAPIPPEQRYTRRLTDKVLIAYHQACDQQDMKVARHLLDVLNLVITRTPTLPAGDERRATWFGRAP
jgi:hypothetical protein